MSPKKKQVALIGGSFNPPTIGHTQLARKVLNTCKNIDEVYLTPCYSHNFGKDLIDPAHRIKMCELACGQSQNISVFDYEIRNKISGGTVTFLEKLLNDPLHKKTNFYYVIGLDVANEFRKWVRWEELMEMVPFIVHPRIGVKKSYIIDWFMAPPHKYLEDGVGVEGISSTEVRGWFKDYPNNKGLIEQHVDDDVIKYILDNNLYAA